MPRLPLQPRQVTVTDIFPQLDFLLQSCSWLPPGPSPRPLQCRGGADWDPHSGLQDTAGDQEILLPQPGPLALGDSRHHESRQADDGPAVRAVQIYI